MLKNNNLGQLYVGHWYIIHIYSDIYKFDVIMIGKIHENIILLTIEITNNV